VTGRRGCLGRLVVLTLLAWPIEELARLLGWSDQTTGSFFLLVLALLAIRSSGPRRTTDTVRTMRAPAARNPVWRQRGAADRTAD
jgi:hypothetical protein